MLIAQGSAVFLACSAHRAACSPERILLMEISGKTRLAGLIGSPVSHSISPKMHNLAFEALGIDCVYLCFDIGGSDLETVVNGLSQIGVLGLNVTMPYKEQIVELMDDLTDAARLSGSCNTICFEDGKMIGHTTDGIGFMRAVADCGCDIIGKKITILGAGGAARSILTQAALDGVARVDLFRRRRAPAYAEAQEFAARISNHTGCKITVCDFADQAQMRSSLDESVLLVNATNIGMAPDDASCPIPDASFLRPDLFVYDIVYNPAKTRLTAMAREAGCGAANGQSMILYQGAASFKCWTGREMPVDLIRDRILGA